MHDIATHASGQVQQIGPAHSASFVYVIATQTPGGIKTYVGWTLDPVRRLEQHNTGIGAKSTRGQTWVLLYLEKHDSRPAAMSREWHLKRDRPFRRLLASQVTGFWGS